MPAAALEVADIFRAAGPAYRVAHAGHLSLHQLKVMAAIVNCRAAALGGHVEGCDDCGHLRVAYNSCRNRHCPKCQGAAARTWLAEREADILPVGYFHVVFTLPAEVADIAWQNKAVVYDLLFRAASETMLTIAADPKHLGARIGITAVLHTWGSAMTHHPHVHMIVPGGGFSLDGSHWIASKPAFLLPVRVLGKLFRRLFLTRLTALHQAGRLAFFGSQVDLADRHRFLRHLAPVMKKRWVVYAKAPFAGPEAVLAYLSRYTHRVAISNRRLIDEVWLVGERRPGGERKYYVSNLPPETPLRKLAATIKARWVCEQAHQQLKEELGLDHFEGRSWTGLHRHALMTMIAFAFLQARRLKAAGRKKKESEDHRPSRACRPSGKPSSTSSHDRHQCDARIVRSSSQMPSKPICQSSASLERGLQEGVLHRFFDALDRDRR